MVELLRHRQTKGAATDMLDLKQPRHTPTLPTPAVFGLRTKHSVSSAYRGSFAVYLFVTRERTSLQACRYTIDVTRYLSLWRSVASPRGRRERWCRRAPSPVGRAPG